MTTLKTPLDEKELRAMLRVNRLHFGPVADAVTELVALRKEVARRANLHDELVAMLGHFLREWDASASGDVNYDTIERMRDLYDRANRGEVMP